MATPAQLAAAAAIAPPPGGGNCHEAVFHWLVQCGSVGQDQVNRLRDWRGGYTNLAQRVLARATDPRILSQMDVLRLNAPGFIVGFLYPVGGLGHSMVTLGGARVAGRNNLNVGGGLAYEQIPLRNLAWQNGAVGGQVVGPNQYRVHVLSISDFEVRFAQEMAAWALIHPLGR